MENLHINIISFNTPYPANYGGVIDVYYKIVALNTIGVKVILHCFNYNRQEAKELEDICEKVYYYNRNTSIQANISLLPYTVYSRKNIKLLKNLESNSYPILFEGLMSSYYINHKKLVNRIKILRECNIEHKYYFALSKASSILWKKIYYLIEGLKLKGFENNIRHANYILAISELEKHYLQRIFPQNNIVFIPAFHGLNDLNSKEGRSEYILYHGNLSVEENEVAAIYLCNHVFQFLKHKCIVSGLKPSDRLKNEVRKFKNVELIENPNEKEMQSLIINAHINILITFQNTGFKLKLIHALFSGRHIIANSLMTDGSGINELCNIANNSTEQIEACNSLMKKTFTQEDIKLRKQFLFPLYSNIEQAHRIVNLIFHRETDKLSL